MVDERPGDEVVERLTFRRRHRLSHARDYQAAFAGKVRATRGPLTVFGRPNELSHSRLGLSVGRRVGPAVVRVRIKRRLREAFRLARPELPSGYDFVVTVRRHQRMKMDRYQQLLHSAAQDIDRQWQRHG